MMHSSQNSFGANLQPLAVTVEILANLIYLSRYTDTHSPQQHNYLDSADEVIEEFKHHPKLHE
jgi:hypothetical protein